MKSYEEDVLLVMRVVKHQGTAPALSTPTGLEVSPSGRVDLDGGPRAGTERCVPRVHTGRGCQMCMCGYCRV